MLHQEGTRKYKEMWNLSKEVMKNELDMYNVKMNV